MISPPLNTTLELANKVRYTDITLQQIKQIAMYIVSSIYAKPIERHHSRFRSTYYFRISSPACMRFVKFVKDIFITFSYLF